MRKPASDLARISHKMATAASDLLALTVGLLDVLSSTTQPCEKSGLVSDNLVGHYSQLVDSINDQD